MLKNYLRTAFRQFRKNKVSTLINIIGLSVGISAALIICMIVQYDYSFDKHEPGNDRIFRLVSEGDGWKSQGVPVPIALGMTGRVSGIENIAPVFDFNSDNLKVTIPRGSSQPDAMFKKQEQVVFTDANYFSVFPHTWLAGNAASALRQPYTIVLAESRARIYFPGLPLDQLIGKTVVFSDTILTTISGIVADQVHNSDFTYATFISLPTLYSDRLKNTYQAGEWNSTNSANQVIVKLTAAGQAPIVEKQVNNIFKEHITGDGDTKTVHRLQPLSDVHFNSDFGGPVNRSTLRNLALLAAFLLMLGAINFINLSTAQASARAKEVGIRKTLGSLKVQLVGQFLTETCLLTFFTTLVSVALMPLLLQAFGGFVPKGLGAAFLLKEPLLWVFLLLLVLVVSLVAGMYPAWVLTRMQPVTVLKNVVVGSTTRSTLLRRILIVTQFVIAQVFLIGVLVVDKQLQYAVNKDMGFRKDAIITFYVPIDFANPNNKKFVLKKELGKLAGIAALSLGNQSPAINGSMTTEVNYMEGGKNMNIKVASRSGDTSFLQVYGIPLVAGRNILNSDTAGEFLINESLARRMGFQRPADAVGHTLLFANKNLPVVGVIRDFNQASVRAEVAPLVYFAAPKYGYVMHIALFPDPAGWSSTIEHIKHAWEGVYPDVDFEYNFLDKQIEKFYKQDRQLSMLLTWSAGVAMLISCLGILGLVIFVTNTRVKEIGVRKVLGATVTQIIVLLSVDFARLLLLAFVIAIPLAWWQSSNWLQDFAYHTALSWWLFVVSGAMMLLVALLIVGVRAGRAAMADPVKSLRTE